MGLPNNDPIMQSLYTPSGEAGSKEPQDSEDEAFEELQHTLEIRRATEKPKQPSGYSDYHNSSPSSMEGNH